MKNLCAAFNSNTFLGEFYGLKCKTQNMMLIESHIVLFCNY